LGRTGIATKGVVPAALWAAVIAAGLCAFAGEDEAKDRVYRWTDASGEEHFTNDVLKAPEPLRSKYLEQEAAEKAKRPKPKDRKGGYVETNTVTRRPFKDYKPADTRAEEEAAEAREEALKQAREKLKSLQETIKKKTDEMNLAAGWETILQIPKYKQEKLRLLGEIEKLKAQVKEQEKQLEELDKAPRE